MAANSAIHGRIWLTFELIRDFIVVHITCKNKEDLIKKEGARVLTTLYNVVCGRIWPNFELIRTPMVVLITCKNEEDPIKMKALE